MRRVTGSVPWLCSRLCSRGSSRVLSADSAPLPTRQEQSKHKAKRPKVGAPAEAVVVEIELGQAPAHVKSPKHSKSKSKGDKGGNKSSNNTTSQNDASDPGERKSSSDDNRPEAAVVDIGLLEESVAHRMDRRQLRRQQRKDMREQKQAFQEMQQRLELRARFWKSFALEDFHAEMVAIFKSVDKDGSGSIDVDEYIAAANTNRRFMEYLNAASAAGSTGLLATFLDMNKNMNGGVSLARFLRYFEKAFVGEMFDLVNTANSGMVTRAEFNEALSKYPFFAKTVSTVTPLRDRGLIFDAIDSSTGESDGFIERKEFATFFTGLFHRFAREGDQLPKP
eukprot:c17956_g1_i4.p1 GENE.c17956_g1_i4~~c17956_g1_i4.p1  ORF type:complete len:337 (+),score=71.44 c17956_g1_i4:689-1699(+)